MPDKIRRLRWIVATEVRRGRVICLIEIGFVKKLCFGEFMGWVRYLWQYRLAVLNASSL